MDLFSTLHLGIKDGKVTVAMPPAAVLPPYMFPLVSVQYTAPVTHPKDDSEKLETVTGFAHKVKVRPQVHPLQQKLRCLLFSVLDAVS